jgi:hypothetical protein
MRCHAKARPISYFEPGTHACFTTPPKQVWGAPGVNQLTEGDDEMQEEYGFFLRESEASTFAHILLDGPAPGRPIKATPGGPLRTHPLPVSGTVGCCHQRP